MSTDLSVPLESEALLVIDPYPLADSVNFQLSKGAVPLQSAERWLSRTLGADVRLQQHHGDQFTAWINGAQQRDLVKIKAHVSRKGTRVAREGKQERMPWAPTDNIEVIIPTMDWAQIGGDMDPGTYGGTIASGDGHYLELIKIQPVREYVGDGEAKDVGFPFWTRVASFDAADLDPRKKEVQSALNSIGMSLETLEEDFKPEQRAIVLAEAMLDYGHADEGPGGWSGDIDIPEKVKWWGDKVAGSEYLEDEDEAFAREVVLDDLDIEHESYGPDKDEPTSGLKVVVRGSTVEITEWTDIEDATGDEQPEGEKIVRQYTEVDLGDLLDPKGKHRGEYSRDSKDVTILEVARMDDEDREKAIVAAAIAYMGHWGGEEEFVDQIGD